MNLRGAVLHVIGDLVQSIGVAFAGLLIWWNQVAPACARLRSVARVACQISAQRQQSRCTRRVSACPACRCHASALHRRYDAGEPLLAQGTCSPGLSRP